MAIRVYVGNLPYSASDEQLADLFSVYGAVAEAMVMRDRVTGQSKGFGFVQMEDDEAARKAMQSLDGTMMAGRTIHVNEADERQERGHEGSPRRDFGDRPPRRDFGGDRGPRRDFGDRPPRRDFGGDRGPRRDFGGDRGPRRDFGGDRGPRRGTGGPDRHEEQETGAWERRHTFERDAARERDEREEREERTPERKRATRAPRPRPQVEVNEQQESES